MTVGQLLDTTSSWEIDRWKDWTRVTASERERARKRAEMKASQKRRR